jgi:hypothetical protein
MQTAMSQLPRAFYFPHSVYRDPDFIWHALLSWGQVDAIVGRSSWSLPPAATDEEQCARDYVLRLHTPTDREYALAHAAISKKFESEPLAYWTRRLFAPLTGVDRPDCFMAAGKIPPETVEMLRPHKLATRSADGAGYTVIRPLGLLVMLAMTQACAGYTHRCITDQAKAYNALLRWELATSTGGLTTLDVAERHIESFNAAANVPIEIISPVNLNRRKLLALRRRELDGNEPDAGVWRHNYMASIESCANSLFEAGSAEERADVINAYRSKLIYYWNDLTKQMKYSRADFVQMGATAGLSALAAPEIPELVARHITHPVQLFATLGLITTNIIFGVSGRSQRRTDALKNNPMAILYVGGIRPPA